MFGNAGHRLFVFDCCSPKIAGSLHRQRNLVSVGSSRTKPNWAISSRPTNASITRQIWVRTNQFVQRPCSRASPDVHHVGGLFTFQTFTRPLHDLYTKLSPGASNQSSHYFKNLGQLRKKTPWTCLERRRLLQFC